jgi:hypothetical protein
MLNTVPDSHNNLVLNKLLSSASKQQSEFSVLLSPFEWKSGGYAAAQLVETLLYKPEGRGFDSRWNHWNFSVT